MTAPDPLSRSIFFEVLGAPVGKARARVTARGTYTPAKTRSWEAAVAWAARHAMAGRPPLDGGPLLMEILACLPVPASWPKRRRAEAADGLLLPATKPDGDNLAKGIADACNRIVYRDDSLIADLIVRKRYSGRPRVEVTVTVMAVETDEWLVRWWPRAEPLPEGWRIAAVPEEPCCHDRWSVLIERRREEKA